jgi:hypothetical protein
LAEINLLKALPQAKRDIRKRAEEKDPKVIESIGAADGVNSAQGDGNNIRVVHELAQQAMERARGRRPPLPEPQRRAAQILSKTDLAVARVMFKEATIPVAEIAKRLGVSRTTIYDYFPNTLLGRSILDQRKRQPCAHS